MPVSLRVNIRISTSSFERATLQGKAREGLNMEQEPREALQTMREAKQAVAHALEHDVSGFRTRTFAALQFSPNNQVTIDLTAIQNGRRQIVCLAETEGVKFIVKRSVLPSTWESRPKPELSAHPHPDFTKNEFDNLQAAMPLSERKVVAPIAICSVESSSGTGHLYSQPYLEGWAEINPVFLRPGAPFFTFYRNILQTTLQPEDTFSLGLTEAVLSKTIHFMTLIYLRSQKAFIPFPSFPAGDIMMDKDLKDIKCVGMLNMLSASSLFNALREGFSISEPGQDAMFCHAINLVGAQEISKGKMSLIQLGFGNALGSGISKGYSDHYGNSNPLDRGLIVRHLRESEKTSASYF